MKNFSIADMQPAALARIMGNDDNPTLAGIAYFLVCIFTKTATVQRLFP